ncbi:unnamed protein product, partial [Ilex paraguariensis]
LRNGTPLMEKWRKFQLIIFYTLKVDASALLTLFKPKDPAVIGSLWFSDQEIIPDFGYDNPVEPIKEGTEGFGWFIQALLLLAQA